MNRPDLTRLLVRVAAIAPHLTGGTREIQTERTETLHGALRDAQLDEALTAIDALLAAGIGRDELTWSRIISDALTIRRRRPDPTPSRIAGVPRPADFDMVVANHRDRVRADALTRTCPACSALPGEPCPPDPLGNALGHRAGHGLPHSQRYDFTSAVSG